jgi:hypothetical protein
LKSNGTRARPGIRLSTADGHGGRSRRTVTVDSDSVPVLARLGSGARSLLSRRFRSPSRRTTDSEIKSELGARDDGPGPGLRASILQVAQAATIALRESESALAGPRGPGPAGATTTRTDACRTSSSRRAAALGPAPGPSIRRGARMARGSRRRSESLSPSRLYGGLQVPGRGARPAASLSSAATTEFQACCSGQEAS